VLLYLSYLFRLRLLSEGSYLLEGLQIADKTKTHPKAKCTHFYRKRKPLSRSLISYNTTTRVNKSYEVVWYIILTAPVCLCVCHQIYNLGTVGTEMSSLDSEVCTELKQLHWLPVAGKIKFKLCLLMHLIDTGRAPQYLVDTVQSVITSSRGHLRSSETTDYVKRTTRTKFGERGFSHYGPAAWNSLQSHPRTIITTNVFKRHLKAFLFTESFA